MQEVILLRASQGPTYYLDLSDHLEVEVFGHPARAGRNAELRSTDSSPSFYVFDLKTYSMHLLELLSRETSQDLSAEWLFGDGDSRESDYSLTGERGEVLRAVLWTSRSKYLPRTVLSPGFYILRIWRCERNLSPQDIHIQSLPSMQCLERIWKLRPPSSGTSLPARTRDIVE